MEQKWENCFIHLGILKRLTQKKKWKTCLPTLSSWCCIACCFHSINHTSHWWNRFWMILLQWGDTSFFSTRIDTSNKSLHEIRRNEGLLFLKRVRSPHNQKYTFPLLTVVLFINPECKSARCPVFGNIGVVLPKKKEKSPDETAPN